MAVVTAFLNGHLEEEIYMEQSEGYVKPGQEHLVCRLRKWILYMGLSILIAAGVRPSQSS